MSNERDKQFNPLVSPDAARKAFQLLERFYDGYTKRNNGYIDADGLQYAGTFSFNTPTNIVCCSYVSISSEYIRSK